ncbi:MAG TPA: aminotransferase class I/II-fold pyridoxal phosphate-dependent enzyme [Candidatus Limnocylindrales bacterium]|nr:aminotransferase class I/II-fold pyridoxal phosphate-dependent enzyme [Candidatus Limnocylindrales bacterium]
MRLPKPRADLGGFAAYRTGQAPVGDVRLLANEWPEPNPASLWLTQDELDAVLLNRYPAAAAELRAVLAAQYGVEPDQLILSNGSNEALLNVFLVFGGHGRRTLLFQPTYPMHGRLTRIAGGTVVDEMVGLPYELSSDRALNTMQRVRPEIVVFTTPNNPTGGALDLGLIGDVAAAYPETLVLVDEAYSDFVGQTIVPAIAERPNIVVSKTFSKVRAAAGLRVGILVVHPRLADIFRAVQLPYNVSSLTHAVALKIARDEPGIARRIELCRTERERVFAALRAIPGIEPFPSVTNFILFRLADGDTAGAHARLAEQGILVRDVSAWPGCAGCLRVSIGTPAENDSFIAALDRAFTAAARG